MWVPTVLQLVNPDAKEALDLRDAIGELEAQLDAKAGHSRRPPMPARPPPRRRR